MTRAALVGASLMLVSSSVVAQAPCPAAKDLPQLTIDKIRDSTIPVMDDWQIFWGRVPISDAQLALLAEDDPIIERTEEEMKVRGSRVYMGMGAAALGAAISSVGWVLYGQNELDSSITLGLAAGGLLIGVIGTLFTTTQIQTPLEPHLAPTPQHRLTRDEARALVARVNRRLYREICRAADSADAPAEALESSVRAAGAEGAEPPPEPDPSESRPGASTPAVDTRAGSEATP